CAATRALTGWAPERGELIAAGFEDKLPEPPRAPRQRPIWRRPDSGRTQDAVGWVVLTVAVLGMIVVLGAIVGSLLADGPATEPAAPPSTTVEPTVPVSGGPVECWPLQPGC
ncbi:MAG: NERD domain-containing protein, partial [Nocardia sp.]|nr:NERD domain-containing protein [Nocardia sp.]